MNICKILYREGPTCKNNFGLETLVSLLVAKLKQESSNQWLCKVSVFRVKSAILGTKSFWIFTSDILCLSSVCLIDPDIPELWQSSSSGWWSSVNPSWTYFHWWSTSSLCVSLNLINSKTIKTRKMRRKVMTSWASWRWYSSKLCCEDILAEASSPRRLSFLRTTWNIRLK